MVGLHLVYQSIRSRCQSTKSQCQLAATHDFSDFAPGVGISCPGGWERQALPSVQVAGNAQEGHASGKLPFVLAEKNGD